MYLSKNSRYVIQRTWFSSHLARHCFTQTSRNYSSKTPKDDTARPALRLNVPKDPPIDPQQHLYLLKGCVESVEKPKIFEKTSQEHLNEINMLLSPPNLLFNENIDKDAVRKAVSIESMKKARSSSQNSSSASKIPKKNKSHDDLEARKKIYESNIPKLKNKLSDERKIVKEVQNIQAKPVNLIKGSKKNKSDLFIELRKNQKEGKIEKRKVKSAENIAKNMLSKDLIPEKKEIKNEAKIVRRTKAQENFDKKNHLDITEEVEKKRPESVMKFSQLDNKNMSLPVKDDYLEAAIENVIPKTKTVEVKMKFRVRIDRIGNAEKEQTDDIESAELAYEVLSDSTKPKTPKTIQTEKVVKDVMKTIVHKARGVFKDKRLNKNLKKEQKVQMVKIHDVANKNFYNEVAEHLTGEGSKYFKKLPFEVTEFNDKNKISNLKRFPYPKTRLEKAVSYHGRINEDSRIQRQYLLNDRFHLPTGDNNDSILNLPRTPSNMTRILKPLGSQIAMIDDVPEYLKYPEFKYMGLSSTASRNFHNTTVTNKSKNDFPHKASVMVMENVIKSRENLGSPKSSRNMLVNRTVNSLGKEIKKPIHMAIPVRVKKVDNEAKESGGKSGVKSSKMPPPQKLTRKYPNRLNKKSSVEGKISSLNNDVKSKTISSSNGKKDFTPEVLFKNPNTDVGVNGSKYLGTNGDLIEKGSKIQEKTLKNRNISVQNEPCCEEDITNLVKRDEKLKKTVQKNPSIYAEESYDYRDVTHYKKDDSEKSMERETPPLSNNRKKKTFKMGTEFELNAMCINQSVAKKSQEKIPKMSSPTKRRQRSTVHKTKPRIINVMKPSTPKISDNFINVANESLSKRKENPSVDSLRMMEKVKTMLDLDLQNAEKIFTSEEKLIPSVVRLVQEPWKWEVNEEDLQKWNSEKIPPNTTSEVSVVCLNKENEWKVIDFPERNNVKKIKDKSGLTVPLDSKSNTSGTDEKSLQKTNQSEKKKENPKGLDCDLMKENHDNKPTNGKKVYVKSVVALNPDSDHFQIINSELTECQKHSKIDLDPVTYDSSALKFQDKSKGVSVISFNENKEFDVDKEALQAVKKKESPINYQNVEEKKGSSIIIYDEKNQSWNIDLSQNNEQPTRAEEDQKQDEEKPSPNQKPSQNKRTDQQKEVLEENRSEILQTSESLVKNDQVLCEGKKEDIHDDNLTPGIKQNEPAKKDHYISVNILEMTKNHSPEKLPKVKANIGETVKIDISSTEHSPSKITEINLNKGAQKSKSEKKVDLAHGDKKSESKPFYENFEKYQTPYSEPDYEDKPIKINSDMKSNPNIKKLDGSNKTLVLRDMSKPNDALDNWLKDETDKMANLLIKVLQEASEAKSKRKLLSSKINEKYLKNVSDGVKRMENVHSPAEEPKTCKIPDKKNIRKSKPKNISEIPVQSAKNIQPPKTVDAVDTNNMIACNEDLKEASLKINQEIFEIPQEIMDPIGINVENLPDLNFKKVALPERLMKMKPNQVKKLLKIPEVPVKPIIGAPLKESLSVNKEDGIDLPGPEGLKKWSLVWKYLPAVGCQATVWIFQLAQIGASIFGTYNSSRVHSRIFDNLFSKYGPIVKLPGPLGGEVLLINRPEHIKAIFDQEGKHSVRSILDSVDRCRLLSQSKSTCFMSFEDWKGSEWEELRKSLVDPTLKVEKYFDFFQEAGKLLVQRISSNRNNHNQVSEDFMDDIKRYSLECLCYVVFDKPLGFLNFNTLDWSVESNRLMKHLSEATDCILKCETGFQMWRFVDTPSSVVLSNACQSLESFIGKHVRLAEMNLAKKKADLASGIIRATDLTLIEHMLLIDGMAFDEVVYTILDMLLIGVNTTSCALGFLLYRLAQNTRVQRMLLKEIRNILPSKDSELNYHRLHSLKYLQACLKESLRLNAPMPLLIRNLHHDVSLPEYRVSKGTFVVMDTQAQCMRENNFEDPEKYFPERWLDPGHMNFSTIPFCHGSKADIGKLLSEIQIWSCVAQMLRNFNIEYNYGDIKGTDEVISFPDKPLKLSFTDREE